jgi:hypothetical protein
MTPEKRVARKPHFCAYCNAQIAKGEMHRAWTWAEDDRLSSNHAHEQCAVMANVVFHYEDGRFEWPEFRQECAERWPGAAGFPWTASPPPSATPPAPSP